MSLLTRTVKQILVLGNMNSHFAVNIYKFESMRYFIGSLFVVLALGCQSHTPNEEPAFSGAKQSLVQDTATFAGGCFWCVEAAFEQIKGVHEVVSGYSGGRSATANYKKVSSGQTRHAEAVQIYYDPNVIDYTTLLEIFFTAHDPTQLNRQGPDVGPQYRSAIFYHDPSEKEIAKMKIKELQPAFDRKIVTKLSSFTDFYTAEEYHQDFEKKNPFHPYLLRVSKPKVDKVRKKFPHLLKEEYK